MTDFIYHEVKPGVRWPDGIMAAAIAALAYPEAVLIGDAYRHESEYGGLPWVVGLPTLPPTTSKRSASRSAFTQNPCSTVLQGFC
jgi:hypothetical protein